MKKIINLLIYEESGQGMVEYSLIFALVIIMAISSLVVLGNTTFKLYEKSLNEMS